MDPNITSVNITLNIISNCTSNIYYYIKLTFSTRFLSTRRSNFGIKVQHFICACMCYYMQGRTQENGCKAYPPPQKKTIWRWRSILYHSFTIFLIFLACCDIFFNFFFLGGDRGKTLKKSCETFFALYAMFFLGSRFFFLHPPPQKNCARPWLYVQEVLSNFHWILTIWK